MGVVSTLALRDSLLGQIDSRLVAASARAASAPDRIDPGGPMPPDGSDRQPGPPDGSEHLVRGVMAGRLVLQPRGGNGFGYDPIFIAEGNTVTNAELSPEAKDAISHRGQAVRAIVPLLREYLRPAPPAPGGRPEGEEGR